MLLHLYTKLQLLYFSINFIYGIIDLLGIRTEKNIQKLFDSRTKEQLTEELSRYAWKNDNENKYAEMIAEGWAEYLNNPNPRPIAKEIGETIERKYEEWIKKRS